MIITWRKVDKTGGRMEVHQDGRRYRAILVNRRTGYYEDMTGPTSKRRAIRTMLKVREANLDALQERYF